jgi:hypothetical protein
MSSSCCGTKKQKLNHNPAVNGGLSNGHNMANDMIAHPEMCFYCFDVLYAHLYNLEQPRSPAFCNDAL